MSVPQVDCAEPVQIDQHKTTRRLLAGEMVEHGNESRPVGEAGKLIGHGGDESLALQFTPLGDRAQDADRPGQVTIAQQDGVDPQFVPAPAGMRRFQLNLDPVGAATLRDCLFEAGAQAWRVGRGDAVPQGQAQQVFTPPASQSCCCGCRLHDLARHIAGQYDLAARRRPVPINRVLPPRSEMNAHRLASPVAHGTGKAGSRNAERHAPVTKPMPGAAHSGRRSRPSLLQTPSLLPERGRLLVFVN